MFPFDDAIMIQLAKPNYSEKTKSVPWLQMSRPLGLSSHQGPWVIAYVEPIKYPFSMKYDQYLNCIEIIEI